MTAAIAAGMQVLGLPVEATARRIMRPRCALPARSRQYGSIAGLAGKGGSRISRCAEAADSSGWVLRNRAGSQAVLASSS